MTSRSTRLALFAVSTTLLGMGALASDPSPKGLPKEPPLATALFAGGCFWSMELAFDKTPGVVSATSGYSGGTKAHPTYGMVSSGTTGHAESVQVVYDPGKVSYAQLLEVFWHNVDPLTANAQFCDRGTEYRSAIFFRDAEQHRLAEDSKRRLERSGRFQQPIVTQIVAASAFYPAEDYHQDYAQKNPEHYQAYRLGCGRDAHLKALWGDDAPKK
ncbi:peptide-methionine (S)-S-oxide reductase MsrA [Stigmatella sp. ncwal1]|uniref:Peptide methionine sulfoxide reductase MsrA n=1 Tax=Stigmatella ashevillensis TaxID=2995309 RepID=A0ABT5D591_9BACT|nr:peptide-methionine (S)-S-oxide reductase MsrA [Stigmatella ashevillena]MDC0708298.1 peptide-methionine (S)-S-oxide reductase MsrA [Stigmatella ashevillena]